MPLPGCTRRWSSGTSPTGATCACAHCYSKSGPGRTTEGELTTAEALGVIDDLADMGVPLILFTGGEPLMREDLFDLARHARDRGLKMALGTNGTLITPEHCPPDQGVRD